MTVSSLRRFSFSFGLPLIALVAACGGSNAGVGTLSEGDSGVPSATGHDGGAIGSGSGGTTGDGAAPVDSGEAASSEAGATSSEAGTPDSSIPDQDAAPIAWVTNPASLVNTLVGTLGKGNTFPGADYPFGMVQWSPDTSPDRTPGGGYLNSDTSLIGFSLTHISGPGCAAYGDFPILPLTGGLPSGDPGSHLEPLSHTAEVGTAGYYTVQSGSPAITTELTATQRSGMARFTFPATTNANLLIKLLASAEGSTASSATVIGTNEIQGSTSSGNFCGKGNKYTVYFDIVFDQPFSTTPQILNASGSTLPSVVFLTFDTTTTQVVQAKTGVSFVSTANANANWNAENPGSQWDFDTVKTAANTAWNGLLDQIQISGGTAAEQQLFYTSLYHSLLHPNVFSDTNGEYIGFDNQTHTVLAPQQAQYANYSGWDIYRGQVQLSAMVAPSQMSDAAQSIVNDATQNNGQLVKWAMANGETYEMIGDPADGIIAGYYAFGATTFDTATALTDMMNEATNANNVRPGLNYYENLGYLPDDGTYGCCNFYGSVSTTLEYAQADFAISQFASALGTAAAANDATTMLARAQNWQNLFDPASGLFNPKLANGTFVSGIGLSGTEGMVEGSAAQYMWEEPFDRQALLTAMGGTSVVNPMLESYFTQLNDCSYTAPYACLTNEQDLGEQYWNDYTGEPWATQSVVNAFRTQVFADAPLFMNNNDDLGAESAALVWSMLGIYPDYPGSAVLTVNSPEFPAALIHLAGGEAITINAPGASTSTPYVQSLLVNGAAATRVWLDASFVQNGGRLDFTLGATPNTTWGASATDAPPSYGTTSTAAIGFVQPNPVVIAPSGPASVKLGAQSTRSDVAETISWKLSPSAGTQVVVAPTSGQFSLAAGAQANVPVTFTAPQAQGTYTVPFELTSSLGVAIPPLVINVFVVPVGSLSPYFNNTGISSDSAPTANFDGSGYSYSAQALATAGVTPNGKVTAGGVSFTWPNVASGQPDNIAVGGQTITFPPATTTTTMLGLLGSASSAVAAGATGNVTINYADNSTQSVPIVFTDWTEGGGGDQLAAGDVVAITTAYRDDGSGPAGTTTYVYAFTTPLTNTSSAVTSVTLPSSVVGGTIHLFDIVVQ